MKDGIPLTIGLPVYNGERHLQQALDSILAQTYTNFIVIISDNASTDRTQEICEQYKEADKRIVYRRNKRNLGAAWNFNCVFNLASTKYFKWFAHDDVIAKSFLEKCIAVLEEDRSAIMCHSKVARIDDFGQLDGTYECGKIEDSPLPHERLSDALVRKSFPWSLFGVFRRDILRKTHLMQGFVGCDWNFLADISLAGRIVEIPEYLFFRRQHSQSYTEKYYPAIVHNYQVEMQWWIANDRITLSTILPRWRSILGFFESSRRIPTSWHEKISCCREVTRWIFNEGLMFMSWDLANEFKFLRTKLNQE